MIHDILQSDIELAKRLLEAGRPDGEVVTVLSKRKLGVDEASRLVADLRQGKRVSPSSSLAAALKTAPPSMAAAEPVKARVPGAGSPARRSARPRSSHSHGHNRKRLNLGWVVIVVLLCVGAVGGAATYKYRYHRETHNLLAQLDALAPELEHAAAASASAMSDSDLARGYEELLKQLFGRKLNQEERARVHASAARHLTPRRATAPGELALDLRSDGVHLGGQPITRSNVLDTLVRILGAPTRTNHLEQSDSVIYAYDQLGLLFQAQTGVGGDSSIVLDFDATGGPQGTVSPFAGKLTVQGRTIGVDTDSNSLAAIPQLGLTNVTSQVLRGSISELGLSFAYLSLKSSQRLSTVVIDFK